MTGYSLAVDLTATIADELDAGEHELLVTVDPTEAGAVLDGSTIAVLVQPPTTSHTTVTIAEHTFEVLTIGPVLDPVQAWPILDRIAEQLVEILEPDSTRLTLYQPAHGDPWPCAVTTLTITTN